MEEQRQSTTTPSFQYHRPAEWYARCPEEVALEDLPSTHPDYIAVANHFHQTLPNQITQIQRVKCKKLYTRFGQKHEEMCKAEGRAIEIRRLFHGTRAHDPKEIYESEVGLDSNLGGKSSTRGTYYALQASTSAGYAHTAPDGTKKMFLCEVIARDFQPQQAICITYEPMMNYPHFIINYRFTPLWYFTCPEQVRLVELQPTDPEYISVASKFNQTLPNNPIVRIQVVQNKSLYTKFAAKHDEMSKAIGRSATIMRLFHGTRAHDPKEIYESEVGLDSNLGGKSQILGTYHAFNSNLSNGYAHPVPDGTKEMFLCEVIVENHLPQQNALQTTVPQLYGLGGVLPQQLNNVNPYSFVQQQGFWVTYQPMMNYPYFLINYR